MTLHVEKLHLGCGGNRLSGWSNHDRDVDIRQPLPCDNDSVRLLFAEHVVEHITPKEAWLFFKEVRRVLRPGGAARFVVPCVDLIFERHDSQYAEFLRQRVKNDGSLEAAMSSIICNWSHQAVWTTHALQAVLGALGFKTGVSRPRVSHFRELDDIDGHHRSIGEHANWVESGVVEAVKWLRILPDGTREYPHWEKRP